MPKAKEKNPNRVAAGKKLYEEGRSGLQKAKATTSKSKEHPLQEVIYDAVDAAPRRRAKPRSTFNTAAAKSTLLPGRVDPLNLTGKSGLFCLHKTNEIEFRPRKITGINDFDAGDTIQERMTFFNDPLTDPNFLMMIAMQGLEKKIKRPKIELLRVEWSWPYSSWFSRLTSGYYSKTDCLALFDTAGQSISCDANGGGGWEPFVVGANTSGTVHVTDINWHNKAEHLPLAIEYNTSGGFFNSAGEHATYENPQGLVVKDFTDGAGHGVLLTNNSILVCTAQIVSGGPADQYTNPLVANKRQLDVFYRVHYVDLLEGEINELLEKQNAVDVPLHVP